MVYCMYSMQSVYLNRVMRNPDFCICENKDIDQLRGNREADQRLCFRYTDSTIPLLSESEISSLLLSSPTHIGFEGRSLVLTVSVPGHCL